MRRILVWTGVVVLACAITHAADTQLDFPASIKTAMTPAEQKAIGTDGMNKPQRDALEKWMHRYCLLVANKAWKASQEETIKEAEEIIKGKQP